MTDATVISMPALREAGAIDPLVSVIERCLRDPSYPLERVEFLIAQRDRERAYAADRAFIRALAAAQEDMGRISTDSTNPQTRSRYASLGAVDRAIRPIYSKHGLAPTFNTEPSPRGEGWLYVTCTLAHVDGHARVYGVDMPADGIGAKGGAMMTRTHAAGSAMTYGRRYLLQLMFNLATGDDDDGNGAASKITDFLTPEQIDHLRTRALEVFSDPIKRMDQLLTAVGGYRSLEQVPADKYDLMVLKIDAFEANKRKAQEEGK